jgi:glycosyltransferase involved in cell wall biosynthesis/SAM-dependent methyltransferase
MKVLMVHNRYRSAFPSGENAVVDQQVEMLRDAGVEVTTFIRESDEIQDFSPAQRVGLAIRPIYSIEDTRSLRALIRSTRPNVVHLHNPYPLISPAVIRTAKAEGVPVVQSVHNYRFACANGLYFRDGHICQECTGTVVPWPAIHHGCYRGSRPQSAVMAGSLALHRSTWRMVDRYLPVSAFVADQLVAAGVPEGRISVVSNSVPDPGAPLPLGKGLLFAGRLEEEKGILILLDAWRRSGVARRASLVVAGDGSQRAAVERAARADPSITYVGAVSRTAVGALLDSCAIRAIPSLWFEGFPLAVVESFARARPVIVNQLGSNATVIDDGSGWLCTTADAAGLARTIQRAFDDLGDAQARGRTGRATYLRSYSPAQTTEQLMDNYRMVIGAADEEAGNPFLRGDRLYGEDLGDEKVAAWVADEQEAYADLGPGAMQEDSYGRGRFDEFHGIRRLPPGRFASVLGLGSASGGEFLAIADRIDSLTIVEPSKKLRSDEIGPLRPRYVDPSPDAALPFADGSFDLIFCLSVLHHLPKVSVQLHELTRVLAPGGHMLVLEPIVSLGDWTGPRKPGLTKRERGIPLQILRSMLSEEGLTIEYEALCDFPLTRRLPGGYDSSWAVQLDRLLSRATAWNYRYHPATSFQKIRPTGSFFVVAKPAAPVPGDSP